MLLPPLEAPLSLRCDMQAALVSPLSLPFTHRLLLTSEKSGWHAGGRGGETGGGWGGSHSFCHEVDLIISLLKLTTFIDGSVRSVGDRFCLPHPSANHYPRSHRPMKRHTVGYVHLLGGGRHWPVLSGLTAPGGLIGRHRGQLANPRRNRSHGRTAGSGRRGILMGGMCVGGGGGMDVDDDR